VKDPILRFIAGILQSFSSVANTGKSFLTASLITGRLLAYTLCVNFMGFWLAAGLANSERWHDAAKYVFYANALFASMVTLVLWTVGYLLGTAFAMVGDVATELAGGEHGLPHLEREKVKNAAITARDSLMWLDVANLLALDMPVRFYQNGVLLVGAFVSVLICVSLVLIHFFKGDKGRWIPATVAMTHVVGAIAIAFVPAIGDLRDACLEWSQDAVQQKADEIRSHRSPYAINRERSKKAAEELALAQQQKTAALTALITERNAKAAARTVDELASSDLCTAPCQQQRERDKAARAQAVAILDARIAALQGQAGTVAASAAPAPVPTTARPAYTSTVKPAPAGDDDDADVIPTITTPSASLGNNS
jgi:hypothetical protein